MKAEEIIELFQQFEAIANEYEGVECWKMQAKKQHIILLTSAK